MSALDVLYITLAAGFLILVILWAYLIVNVVRTLKVARQILHDIKDSTQDIRGLKNQLKWGILGVISTLFKRR